MHISFIALNRIVEERAASDRNYRQRLERAGKVQMSGVRKLPDEVILAKLKSIGIELDRATLAEWSRTAASAEELSEQLRAKGIVPPDEMDDWMWLGLTVLWERWLPQQPSFEMLDDKIQAGCKQVKKDAAKACETWLDAWQDIMTIMDTHQIKDIDEFDERFGGSEMVSNWLGDLAMHLSDAGTKEPRFLHCLIALCEEVPRRWPNMDNLTKENFRRDLAVTHFRLGDTAIANDMFQGWLKDDPEWGCGWIGWSNCYSWKCAGSRNLDEAERILKLGLDVGGVRDRVDILDRLIMLYTETGRDEEAADAEAQIDALDASLEWHRELDVESDNEPGRIEKMLQIHDEIKYGGESISLDRQGNEGDWPTTPSAPRPTRMPIVGRNEPCPCGSGKKFKKCCGR